MYYIFLYGHEMYIISQAYFLTGIAIIISVLNYKTFKTQPTVAVLISSLIISLIMIFYHKFAPSELSENFLSNIKSLDFSEILMEGILGFLLFAGSLSVDIEKLSLYKKEISVLAFIGTISSMFMIAILLYLTNDFFNILSHLSFAACILFGALISPTDPIAVLNTLKQSNAPKSIETILAGESLFNDGIGIVCFLTIYSVLFEGGTPSLQYVASLFCTQSIGGLFLGLLFGWISINTINKCIKAETLPQLITIVIPTAGYSICNWLDVSGPLAMVSAGIYVAYKCPKTLSKKMHEFWLIIDELLNIILFLLVGFEVILIPWESSIFIMMILATFTALLVRSATVLIPMTIFKTKKNYEKNTESILIWGGLRGGLALALALGLPESFEYKTIIIAMTYGVVLSSILIQGTTIKKLT